MTSENVYNYFKSGFIMRRLSNVVTRHFAVLFLMSCIISLSSIGAHELYPNDDEYLIVAETMPAPVGGMEGIVKRISSMGIFRSTREGKVYLLAYINEKGEVDDAKVVKGIGGGCDEAAAEALKKTKFTPAVNGGKPVKVKMTLAIMFKS